MLLYRGTVPVGTVSVYRDDEEEDAAFIDNLSVAPGSRGVSRSMTLDNMNYTRSAAAFYAAPDAALQE